MREPKSKPLSPVLEVFLFGFMLNCAACSTEMVRSTVDSYGDEATPKTDRYYFDLASLNLLGKQSVLDCKTAARDAGLTLDDSNCSTCHVVSVRTHLGATEQVIHSTPGFANTWNGWGRRSRFGTTLLNNSDVESHPEAGREIDIEIYANSASKNASREIEIRSLGPENSVSAVAYDLCKAAFQDYPQNLKGKFYDLKRSEVHP